MNELIGTSYFYLKKYFGKAITEFDGPYLDYLPKDIPPPYEPMAPEVPDGDIKEPDIEGSQAPGKQILVNKKGEEIASMTFTELPTSYSINKNNSVGLEINTILSNVNNIVETQGKDDIKMTNEIAELTDIPIPIKTTSSEIEKSKPSEEVELPNKVEDNVIKDNVIQGNVLLTPEAKDAIAKDAIAKSAPVKVGSI